MIVRLPGQPDMVFASRRKIIFVHGCFWHQHEGQCAKRPKLPVANRDYWLPKLKRNIERDLERIASLEALGWRVLVVWECEIDDRELLRQRLVEFLEGGETNTQLA